MMSSKDRVHTERNLVNETAIKPTAGTDTFHQNTNRSSATLTSERKVALRIRQLSSIKPVKEIHSQDDLKQFFQED